MSLQQFQDISSGKYNAGEVKLASATRLGKMNHHVRQRFRNDEMISHQEVIAIKEALVEALSQHGVDPEEIGKVRRELGLAPDGAADRQLHARRQPAPLAEIQSTTMKMQQIDGTTQGGRDLMLGDLKRPVKPTYLANGQEVLAPADCHFTVVIGGETIACAVSGQDAANAHVADRIEALCGKVHVEQANAVMRGLSQAGHPPILEILPQHGIDNPIGTEHMPLAYKISKNEATGAIGADLFEIVPEKPYTAADLDWRDKKSRSSVEMADRASRPAIAGAAPALEDYATVYVGFPIWWYREPSIVDTFVESNAAALAGKTVVPFATSGGSGMGDSTKNLQALAPEATVKEGRRFPASVAADDLADWAAKIR